MAESTNPLVLSELKGISTYYVPDELHFYRYGLTLLK